MRGDDYGLSSGVTQSFEVYEAVILSFAQNLCILCEYDCRTSNTKANTEILTASE